MGAGGVGVGVWIRLSRGQAWREACRARHPSWTAFFGGGGGPAGGWAMGGWLAGGVTLPQFPRVGWDWRGTRGMARRGAAGITCKDAAGAAREDARQNNRASHSVCDAAEAGACFRKATGLRRRCNSVGSARADCGQSFALLERMLRAATEIQKKNGPLQRCT